MLKCVRRLDSVFEEMWPILRTSGLCVLELYRRNCCLSDNGSRQGELDVHSPGSGHVVAVVCSPAGPEAGKRPGAFHRLWGRKVISHSEESQSLGSIQAFTDWRKPAHTVNRNMLSATEVQQRPC